MRIPPSFIMCAALIAGIAIGGSVLTSDMTSLHGMSITAVSAYIALTALLLAAVMRRHGGIATSLLLCAVFSLGVFLIKGERHVYSVPFEEQVVSSMGEKRAELVDTYQQCGLKNDEYAVVTAMTLGERTYVSRELKETYNVSGASHVFALSGMHLGIIYALLTLLLPWKMTTHLGRMRRPSQLALAAILVAALWTYVLLVGARPSIMRAAVMLTVYTVARRMSRQPDGFSVLLFTLAFLLVIWPQWLFDIGFQMSFMAVASITLLYVPFNNWLTERYHRLWHIAPLRIIAQTAILSTCAQIGVAPLIALYFHRFSTYFLFTNLPVPILASAVIYLSILLLTCASLRFTLVTHLIAGVLKYVTSLLNHYLAWVSSLPYASIDGIYTNKMQTFLIYAIIICFCMIVYRLHHGVRRRLGDV